MKYILALDQGTTSSRAIVFDESGAVKSVAHAEFGQIYPREGWVEHDPLDIYSSQAGTAAEAIARGGFDRRDIAAIGITNQRETTIVWDRRTGKPVHNAVVWQCRRTAERCDRLKRDGLADVIYKKTGLPIDPYFSATKLEWILDRADVKRESASRGDLLFGTVDSYLMWKLSGGAIHATDYTNASRTMLFNIHTLDWDDELLEIFGVPRAMLPEVKPSSAHYGYTDESEFGARVPITGVAGDQQAALFGHRCFDKGTIKNTFGTGCFLLMNTGSDAEASTRGLITTLAASDGDKPQYALEGSVFMGGAVVQWLRDSMRIIRTAEESESYARAVDDTLGVYIVPAFVGLGAPHWDSYARGTVTGLTRGTTREHFVRAALESIDYRVLEVLRAMEDDCGTRVKNLAVDGGASVNGFLMQFMADIADVAVVRPEVAETTALGACYLAGLSAGVFDMDFLRSQSGGGMTFYPSMEEQKREALIRGWKDAVRRTLGK